LPQDGQAFTPFATSAPQALHFTILAIKSPPWL
jgi:hypothetical protein